MAHPLPSNLRKEKGEREENGETEVGKGTWKSKRETEAVKDR